MFYTSMGQVPEWMEFGGSTLEGSSISSDPELSKKGFSYKGGSDRNTEGIWIWSEPFIIPNKYVDGEKTIITLCNESKEPYIVAEFV